MGEQIICPRATAAMAVAILASGEIGESTFLPGVLSIEPSSVVAANTVTEQVCRVGALGFTCLGMVVIFNLDLNTAKGVGLPTNMGTCTSC